MLNILRGLYNGKIIPWERREPLSGEFLEIIHKIEAEERYFMEKMSLDDCRRFQALSHLRAELGLAEEGELFSYGFSLGLLLMIDVAKEAELFGPSKRP